MSPPKRIGTVPTHTKREIVVTWTVGLILVGIPWLFLVWLMVKEIAS